MAMGIPSIATIQALSLKLQVKIAICGSVHQTPKLALAGRISICGRTDPFTVEDFVCRSGSAPQNIRTEFNTLLQIAECGSCSMDRPRTTRMRSGKPVSAGT